jgi:hypothetical protein
MATLGWGDKGEILCFLYVVKKVCDFNFGRTRVMRLTIYGSADAFSRAGGVKNQVASLVCYDETYGDVAVVASGPMPRRWPDKFLADELNATLAYYKTEDRKTIFGKREMSRVLGGMGMGGNPGIPSFAFH